MEDLLAFLGVTIAAAFGGMGTVAAYQIARHFRRLNGEADRAATPRKATDANAATVTRSELEAMIRSAVRESAPGDDVVRIPPGASETAPRVR